ncbi:hypothetical protein C0Q70_11350 [Pomacea canaliculata]|uniref:Phospholipase A2 n=1 Tax=Pomacea canaliculata TaxID=400727 RepID=A0A2T7P5P9_POMCA|nr:hypothetical protein C0Q70_11350 [Pomacea canaliculata]
MHPATQGVAVLAGLHAIQTFVLRRVMLLPRNGPVVVFASGTLSQTTTRQHVAPKWDLQRLEAQFGEESNQALGIFSSCVVPVPCTPLLFTPNLPPSSSRAPNRRQLCPPLSGRELGYTDRNSDTREHRDDRDEVPDTSTNNQRACELIRVHTNRGCFDYYQYGCFCGLGNAGTQEPLDDVDECCRQHDRCYGQVTCLWFYPQFVGFDYTCTENGTCTCTDDQLWSPCARSVCDCELTFAQCLGNARYNGQLRNYDWRQCVSHEQPHLSSP